MILFFVFVITGTYAGGVIDGIDGLAGGVFAIIFGAYGVIAFSMGMGDLAAFCLATTGALCAFLWFNIPPARFFLSDTGTMGLTTVLATVAFITDTLLLLPVLAFPLVITVLSNIIQILSKKFRNKKVFLVAPLHNHFQALGWPSYKVTMRYWIITIMSALVGVILVLLDKTYK
jgi:phospho-N-acetylmuramoyl-pentapeptide-transferase